MIHDADRKLVYLGISVSWRITDLLNCILFNKFRPRSDTVTAIHIWKKSINECIGPWTDIKRLIIWLHYITIWNQILYQNLPKELIGDAGGRLVMKKRSSMCSWVVGDKQLSSHTNNSNNPRCVGGSCLQCLTVFKTPKTVFNYKTILISKPLTCQ